MHLASDLRAVVHGGIRRTDEDEVARRRQGQGDERSFAILQQEIEDGHQSAGEDAAQANAGPGTSLLITSTWHAGEEDRPVSDERFPQSRFRLPWGSDFDRVRSEREADHPGTNLVAQCPGGSHKDLVSSGR